MDISEDTLQVVSQSSRFEILAVLNEKDKSIYEELEEVVNISTPGVKKHMDKLKKNDLVEEQKKNVIFREHKKPYTQFRITGKGEDIVNELIESPVFNRKYQRVNHQLIDQESVGVKNKDNNMFVKHANKYGGGDYKVDVSENGVELVLGSIGSGKTYSNKIKIKSFLEEHDEGYCVVIDPLKSYTSEMEKYPSENIDLGEKITGKERFIHIYGDGMCSSPYDETQEEFEKTVEQLYDFANNKDEPVMVIMDEGNFVGGKFDSVDVVKQLSEKAFVIITGQSAEKVLKEFIPEDPLIQSFYSHNNISKETEEKLLDIHKDFGCLEYLFPGSSKLGFSECVLSDIGRATVKEELEVTQNLN